MPWKLLLTDHQIVARVLSGRRNDFEILVRRHLPMAQAVAYAQLGQRSEVEDVIQEGFVKAYTALDQLQNPEQFRSWLASIIRNLAMSALRREVRESKAPPALAQTDAKHPSVEIERRDLLAMLETEISALHEPYREVLLMHYFSGMKVREVADALNISKEVAAKRLQRGRQALSERVLGVLDASSARKLEKGPRVKAIMGLITASPVVWSSATASAGVATILTPYAAKIGISAALAVSALSAFLWFQWPDSPAVNDGAPAGSPSVSVVVSAESSSRNASSPALDPSATVLPADTADSQLIGIGVITGAVLDPYGAPVAGATVRVDIVYPPDSDGDPVIKRYGGTADADGRFRVENLPLELAWITGGVPGSLAATCFAVLSEDFPEWFVWLEPEAAARVAGQVFDASGQPVAEATLTPRMWNGEEISRLGTQVMPTPEITDANGHFSFDWLLPGAWAFEVAAPGYAPQISDDIPSEKSDATVVVSTGAPLGGAVIAADTGQPVPGATIRLYPSDRFLRRTSAETAEDGTFRFDHLAPGTYALTFSDAADAGFSGGYCLAEAIPPVEVPKDRDAPSLQLVVEPGAAVSGIVVAPDGLPGSGCTVVASKGGGSEETQTDENGRYRIAGLVPGEWIVTAHPRFPGSEQSLVLEAATTRDGIDFRYPEGAATITGVVTDDAGNPLPDVEVAALDQYWNRSTTTATTGEDGTFRIEHVASADMLWIRPKKPGWVGQDIMTRLTDRGITGLTMTMTQPATILGKVVDAAGLPVEDVTVWHRGVDISVYTATSSRTTKGGRFAFARLVPGDYRLLGQQEGAPEIELGQVRVKPGEVLEDVTLVFPEGSGMEIAGTVADASHNPIPGALLNIYPQTGPGEGIHTTTDQFGRFVFAGLQEGKYRLLARGNGYGTTELTDVKAGQRDLHVELLVTASVQGRVLARGSGDPVPKFYITVIDGERDRVREYDTRQATLVTNESGDYVIADVNAGTHTVAAWADGYAPSFQVVDVIPGQRIANTVLWLEPDTHTGANPPAMMTVSGIVVDDAGRTIEGAALYLDNLPSAHERLGLTVARTGADGQFIIEEVPQDTKLIVANHDAYAVGGTELSGSPTGLTIVLPAAGAIEGTIHQDGVPVAGQFVVARFKTRGYEVNETAQTNATGAYTLKGIPEGPATVSFWRATGGTDRNYTCEVIVDPGRIATADFDFFSGSSQIAGILLVEGNPVRGKVRVRLDTDDGMNDFDVYADDQGLFRVSELPATTLQLEATANIDGGNYAATQTISLGAGELASVELGLSPSGE